LTAARSSSPPPPPPATDGIALDHGNRYSQQLLAHRETLVAQERDRHSQAVWTHAQPNAFDSLRPATLDPTGTADRAAIEHLAAAAARRMMRWADPATGGLDAMDREDLLRQAGILGLRRDLADQALDGAEAAHRARIALLAEAEDQVPAESHEAPRRLRWRVPFWLLLVLVAVVTQIGVLIAWQYVSGLFAGG
jgi:hypothetical protein